MIRKTMLTLFAIASLAEAAEEFPIKAKVICDMATLADGQPGPTVPSGTEIKIGSYEAKGRIGFWWDGFVSATMECLSEKDRKKVEKAYQADVENLAEQEIVLAEENKEHEEKVAEKMSEGFSREEAEAIIKDRLSIGMREEVVIEIQGRPEEINQTRTASGTQSQWVYCTQHRNTGAPSWKLYCTDYSYLYFENGVLTAIQN